jgi:hypothetical protein
MQNPIVISVALLASLVGCSSANDPYANIKDPPIVQGNLHTVTLVSADPTAADQLQKGGYAPQPFPPNYQEADAVLGMLWDVPEAVAKSSTIFRAPQAGWPNLRLAIEPPPAAKPADPAVERSFYRNVLGVDVPKWPEKVAQSGDLRVLVRTYQVKSILDARRRLRENTIPVVTEPVGITTPYLGDQKSLSLRAPDGTIVELVETAAQ